MKTAEGYEALRRFRQSIPNCDYFVTLTTTGRQPGLTTAVVGQPVRRELAAIEADGHWHLRAAVIMPDHLHFLVTLHDRLSLDRTIARLKSKTRSALQANRLTWQGNFYEHRLRENESIESVIFYIYLNPYRADLLKPTDTYPWFWLGAPESTWFRPRLDDGKPFPEWLGELARRERGASKLATHTTMKEFDRRTPHPRR